VEEGRRSDPNIVCTLKKIGVMYIARAIVNKDRIIMRKNGRQQSKEHNVLLSNINKQCSNYITKNTVLQETD
jgi:hypothetical protein